MRGPGFFEMLQIAAGISMAGPMLIVGVEFLRAGSLVGGVGFFALGLVALFFPSYLVRRIGGPRTWIRRRLGRTGDDTDDDDPDGGDRSTVLDRFAGK